MTTNLKKNQRMMMHINHRQMMTMMKIMKNRCHLLLRQVKIINFEIIENNIGLGIDFISYKYTLLFYCKSIICQADEDEEMCELNSDESEGKDWDELEAEAAKGKENLTTIICLMI